MKVVMAFPSDLCVMLYGWLPEELCVYHFVALQEYEIDKKLGIKGPEDVAKLGIAQYNNECRKIVMRYSTDWEVCIINPIHFPPFCIPLHFPNHITSHFFIGEYMTSIQLHFVSLTQISNTPVTENICQYVIIYVICSI